MLDIAKKTISATNWSEKRRSVEWESTRVLTIKFP